MQNRLRNVRPNVCSELMNTLMQTLCRCQLKSSCRFVIALSFAVFSPFATIIAAEPPVTDTAFAPDGKSIVAVSQAGIRVLPLARTIDQTGNRKLGSQSPLCLVFAKRRAACCRWRDSFRRRHCRDIRLAVGAARRHNQPTRRHRHVSCLVRRNENRIGESGSRDLPNKLEG